MSINHKYSLHQKFCLDYCWDQKNVNLNYEEHCGCVNFLVESNWSLKGKRETIHHVCFQRNQPSCILRRQKGKDEGKGEGKLSKTWITSQFRCRSISRDHMHISFSHGIKLALILQLEKCSLSLHWSNSQTLFHYQQTNSLDNFNAFKSPNIPIQKLTDILSSTLDQKT